jgi:hypothetical protein
MNNYEKYKRYLQETLQDSIEWKMLSDEEKEKMTKYIMENEEIVADVLYLIMKEKELN